MKKIFILLLISLLLTNIGFAAEDPSIDGAKKDYEKVNELTEKIPLDEDGKIDEKRLNQTNFFIKSRTEERIDEINEWLNENVDWLYFFFRMVPQLTWTFFLNLYIIVVALTYLIFRTDFIRSLSFGLVEEDIHSRIIGSALFFIFLFTNIYSNIAMLMIEIIEIFFTKVLPWGLAIAIILVLLFSIILIALAYFAPWILAAIARALARLLGKKIVADSTQAAVKKAEEKFEKLSKKQEKQIEDAKSFAGEGYYKRG